MDEKSLVKALINENLNLLPVDKIIFPDEALQRASKLLKVKATLAEYKRQLQDDKVKYSSTSQVTYSKLLVEAPGKTVTEKESTVKSNPEYIVARETVEITDNNIKYIDTMLDVFTDGHLLLRQMGKEKF